MKTMQKLEMYSDKLEYMIQLYRDLIVSGKFESEFKRQRYIDKLETLLDEYYSK